MSNILSCFGLLVKRFALHSRLSRLAGRSERRAHPGPPADAFVFGTVTREVTQVTFKNAEEELAEFLAPYGAWLERCFRGDATVEDLSTLCEQGLGFSNITAHGKLKEQYESILRRIPARWREYCKIKSRLAQEVVGPPAGVPGRPRKDALAGEAELLQSESKSYAQIAQVINSRHGEGTTTKEAVRKLLSPRRKGRPPDKT
jgi:hypothetical protein